MEAKLGLLSAVQGREKLSPGPCSALGVTGSALHPWSTLRGNPNGALGVFQLEMSFGMTQLSHTSLQGSAESIPRCNAQKSQLNSKTSIKHTFIKAHLQNAFPKCIEETSCSVSLWYFI